MNQSFYSIYDSKAGAYLPPFLAQNQLTAARLVVQAAQDPSHNFHAFASDYTLFEIGEWDEEQGLLVGHEAHVNCGNVRALLDGHEAQSNIHPVGEL